MHVQLVLHYNETNLETVLLWSLTMNENTNNQIRTSISNLKILWFGAFSMLKFRSIDAESTVRCTCTTERPNEWEVLYSDWPYRQDGGTNTRTKPLQETSTTSPKQWSTGDSSSGNEIVHVQIAQPSTKWLPSERKDNSTTYRHAGWEAVVLGIEKNNTATTTVQRSTTRWRAEKKLQYNHGILGLPS